jgi:3-methyl-2-oxobutanoate hydroxymethyltransferase
LKNTIELFIQKKGKEKITMLTAYDYATAGFLDECKIDSILVGDSLGMVFQGNQDTLKVTLDDIIYHCKAVRKGAPNAFIIADMPFLTYHINRDEAVRNAGRVIQESGVEAVKLEGGEEVADKIEGILSAKIPVMGHLGLTPQSINVFGGYKIQGKTYEKAYKLIKDALLLEKLGVFAIVLEGIPEDLGKLITQKLSIPTIGIGAGKYTDGQVLVINDVLGLFKDFSPKFAKVFADVGAEVKKGINRYINDVKNNVFPEEKHTFKIDKEIIDKLSKDKF